MQRSENRKDIYVNKLNIIGSDNGMSPGRRQAIIWTNAGILSNAPSGTKFGETLIGIHTFSFKEMYLKMSSAKWRPFFLGLKVLTVPIIPRNWCNSIVDELELHRFALTHCCVFWNNLAITDTVVAHWCVFWNILAITDTVVAHWCVFWYILTVTDTVVTWCPYHVIDDESAVSFGNFCTWCWLSNKPQPEPKMSNIWGVVCLY